MRAPPDDRTSRARIRDEALRLFAARGADAVTVRQIAAAARVSPALVVRHFGSKDGLRDEVDRHVLRSFEAMLGEMTSSGAPFDPGASGSLVESVVQHLPPSSPIPAYLRRMLLDGGKAGRKLFRRLFESGQASLDALVKAGVAAPSADPEVRAAFLTANDLAMILLREPLAEVLGVDPLTKEGMSRWVAEVLAVCGPGLGAPPPPKRSRRR